MAKKKVIYTLELDSTQAKQALAGVELLMRLKLNQYNMISEMLIPLTDKHYRERYDDAEPLLKEAFEIIRPSGKDNNWYVLYNIYQALRYAIHEAEYPETTGVDSSPPLQLSEEPIPKCSFEFKED